MKRNKLLLSVMLCLLSAICCQARNSMAPMSVGNVFIKLTDPETAVAVRLSNYGDTEVNNISYTFYNVETQQSEGPFTINFDTPIAIGETRQVGIIMKPGSKLGKEDIIFNITQVNGESNEASMGYTYITRCTVNKVPHKRVLIEDYTALWCQYCPVGIVATEALVREYPDDVVAVSIHKYDKISNLVSPDTYQNGMMESYAEKLPAVWCARDSKIAGYDGTSIYENEKSRLTYMNIDVKAHWDETGDNINVTTEVEPCMTPEEESTYAVGYVLTASGLKDDSWYQQANYSYYMSDSFKDAPQEMDFFRNPDNYVNDNYYVKGLTFNHVAIESKGIRNGVENSLTGDFEMNKTKTHSTTFSNIGKYSIIQDRNRIQVVAILFNNKTKKVENAAVCNVTKPSETFSMSFEQCDWATLYTDRACTVPCGIETYRIDAEGNVEPVSDGNSAVSIAACTPLLLKGKQGDTYTFEYADASDTAVETALRGSTTDELTTTGSETLTDSDVYYYRLTCDEAHPEAGFYWAADDGGAFTNEAGRCYLVLQRSNVAENRKEGFALDDDGNDPTGIKHTESTSSGKAHGIFDAAGRKLNAATIPGLYIVNGRKVILK